MGDDAGLACEVGPKRPRTATLNEALSMASIRLARWAQHDKLAQFVVDTLGTDMCGFERPLATSDGGVVVPPSWAGCVCSPDEARAFAATLLRAAEEAEAE